MQLGYNLLLTEVKEDRSGIVRVEQSQCQRIAVGEERTDRERVREMRRSIHYSFDV